MAGAAAPGLPARPALQAAARASGLRVDHYALAIRAVALWGVYVFSQTRPSLFLMQVAFLLFAVNVLVAGVLSLANTLG